MFIYSRELLGTARYVVDLHNMFKGNLNKIYFRFMESSLKNFSLNNMMRCYLCATQCKATASSQILISIWCVHMGGQFIKPSEINKLYFLFDLNAISCNKAGAMKSRKSYD